MKNQELVKVQIPKGYTAKIEGNEVRIVKVENEFRDGDILACNEEYGRCPFIFKGYDEKGFSKFYTGIGCGGDLIISTSGNERWGKSELSYATEEEKQLLFDKMKEKGLLWDAEEKKVEKIRWRARLDEDYYYLSIGGLVMIGTEYQDNHSENVWEFGNHFRTEEQAMKAKEVVKEALRKFHEENY